MTKSLDLKGTVVLFLVVFGGVFSALWLDNVVDRNQDKAYTLANIRDNQPDLTPINYDPLNGPFNFSDAADRVIRSVVSIDTAYIDERIFGDMRIDGGSGSGVVIEGDGYIVTNAHVVRNPRYRTELKPADIVTVRTSDGREYDAKVVGMDPVSDLAVLKVDTNELEPAEFGDSDQIRVGEWVMAVGNQLGFDNSVSVGVVSSKNRWRETQDSLVLIDAIQTDASINRGNSGGALCNSQGQIIGINTIIATVNQVTAGVGFAIPSKHVLRVVADLIEFGEVQYAVLGIDLPRTRLAMTVPRNREILMQVTGYDNPPDYGLRFLTAIAGYPATKAGMTDNSVIMEIDGRRLYNRLDYIRSMMEKKPGDEADIKFWSNGEVKEVTVTLARP